MSFEEREKKIAAAIDPRAGQAEWEDWKWQLEKSITDIRTFEKVARVSFSRSQRTELKKTIEKFPFCITPYYLSLVDISNYKDDPIFRQALPDPLELIVDASEMKDPLCEDRYSPVEGLTHRYPDRVLFLISSACSMYCRHCTRKRKVGERDFIPTKDLVEKGIEYIKKTPVVRDVLLSGGDPLMLADDYLDWILTELWKIPHVEVVRIGTRMPVTLPYRITDALVETLKKHHPLWIHVHFNHPRELTPESKEAIRKLADGGFPLANQTVLLAGINDSPRIIKELGHQLVRCRIRPYYLYQCDLSEGLSHFRTPISKGIEILENLIGHTSGFSVPTYVVDAPGGGGKIPLTPNYILAWSNRKVVLRNYLGYITAYKEPENYQEMAETAEMAADPALSTQQGVAKILSGSEENVSLTPCETSSDKKN